MDYKEKYENALEKAKKELNVCGSMDCDAAKQIFRFFPELKESEDEIIREWCISHFKECINVTKDNDEYKEYLSNKVIAWLEKQSEQKPAWSKEDEGDLYLTISLLDKFKEEAYTNDCENCINWLKSLKPQSHWKPTDEQIMAFEHFVKSIGESEYASPYDNNTKLIYLLLNDLKKL